MPSHSRICKHCGHNASAHMQKCRLGKMVRMECDTADCPCLKFDSDDPIIRPKKNAPYKPLFSQKLGRSSSSQMFVNTVNSLPDKGVRVIPVDCPNCGPMGCVTDRERPVKKDHYCFGCHEVVII